MLHEHKASNLKNKRRKNAIHPVNGYENHEDNEEEEVSLVNYGKDRSSPVVMVMMKYPLGREGLEKLRSVELLENKKNLLQRERGG